MSEGMLDTFRGIDGHRSDESSNKNHQTSILIGAEKIAFPGNKRTDDIESLLY